MKSIGLVSWKGGTGKTTLACNLAERAGAAGLNTTLCDFDPQSIALRHCQLRAANNPDASPLKGVRGSLSVDGIAALRAATHAEGCDLLVCDLPGADSFTLDQALSNIDLLLLPVTTAPYDILVTANLVRHGIDKGWNMALLPNNLTPSKTRTLQKLEVFQQMGVAVAPVGLIRRVSYWDASEVGLGVCEYAPRSPAAAEMQQLWDWIAQRLELPGENRRDSELKEASYA